jgi:putative glycosyltransferase (TIGR04372 family)
MPGLLGRFRTFRRSDWRVRKDRIRRYLRTGKHKARTGLFFPLYGPLAFALSRFGWRLCHGETATSFGALSTLPGTYLKARQINLIPQWRSFILAHPKRVPNSVWLDYWRDDFFVVSNWLLLKLMTPLLWMPWIVFDPRWEEFKFHTPDGPQMYGGPAYDHVTREFRRLKGTNAILKLSADHLAAGREHMREFGLDHQDWWVCFHSREAASNANHIAPYRDTDISTYRDAACLIIERGGWIVRIGDPLMSAMAPMERVIDYVHTDTYSDMMNVYLLAECRFLVAASSGPVTASGMFGRPVVGLNYTPLGVGTLTSDDLYIPQHPFHFDDGRLLTFAEALSQDFRSQQRTLYRDEARISLRNNTPKQIRAVTQEMLDRLDGTLQYTEKDERLQAKFKELLARDRRQFDYGHESRIGRDYLREFASLLPD